jgi:hypothetical protein
MCTPGFQTLTAHIYHTRSRPGEPDDEKKTRMSSKIQIHQICDKKKDCPEGNDELWNCDNLSILPAVRCTREHIFVDYEQVGDGYVHCQHSYDDELATYFTSNCSVDCKCTGFAVVCQYLSGTVPPVSGWTKTLKLHGQKKQTESHPS